MNFFNINASDIVFEQFGLSHLLIILFAIILCFVTFKNPRKLRRKDLGKWICLFFVFIVLAFEVMYQVWSYSQGEIALSRALPLSYYRLGILFAILALHSKSNIIYNIFYFIGSFSIFNLIFPGDFNYSYNYFMFYHYFIGNIFVIWTMLYLAIVNKCHVKLTYYWINIFTVITLFLLNLLIYQVTNYNTFSNMLSYIPYQLTNLYGFNIGMIVFFAFSIVYGIVSLLPWLIKYIFVDRNRVDVYDY